MHYPHKSSNIKRARKIGFRARMKSKKGRQMISRKRRVGRQVQVV
jgi:ribosomal protein L34